MASTILVTGGTGTLGTPTVARLRAAGHEVRVLSRRPGEGRMRGDLTTGEGLAEALAGADTVLHLANGTTREAEHTRRLVGAATAAGTAHLVYISIVGIDGNPLGYYRQKVAAERAIADGDVPWTVLRATQFHDFVAMFARPQRRLPLALLPNAPLQPIDVDEVAARLVELAGAAPAGRVADIAGPEQDAATHFAAQWYAAHGHRTRAVGVRIPGRMGRMLRAGSNLGTLPGYGTRTFAEWAVADAARRPDRATNGT